MEEPNSNTTAQFIVFGFICLVGTAALILFVMALETGQPWATASMQYLLKYPVLSMLSLIVLCSLVCLFPFRKGK